MTLSVVMGTWNGAAFVQEQLESVLRQTLLPDEILVSDDCSDDETLEIVARMAATSSVPIRIHRNAETLGCAGNFFTASARASGDHIAFCDQDDRWYPHKLERCLQALQEHDAVLCAHAVNTIDEEGKRLRTAPVGGPPYSVAEMGEADPWGNHYGFTLVFHRTLLDHLPFEQRGLDPYDLGKPAENDRWVYFLASTFGRIVHINEPLADYRQHPSQMYGVGRHRSRAERLATKVAEGVDHTLYLAELSATRAALLDTVTGDGESAARAAAARWRRLADGLYRSAPIYSDLGALARWRTFSINAVRGHYRHSRHGGLGSKRLRHDLVMAGFPRRFAKAVSPRASRAKV